MKIIIAGGGTGGHLYPALAIASEFKARDSSNELLFVGTLRGLEQKVVPKEGFNIQFIKVEGIVNVGLFKLLKSLMTIPKGLIQSRAILETFDPHVVIGVGGYASGPVLAMASWMGFPTMIHEQNAVPGLTNRLLGNFFVDTVAVTYPDSRQRFRNDKTFLTGNPVRASITSGDRQTAMKALGLDENLFTVFVLGGSRGAHSLNVAMVDALKLFSDTGMKKKIQVIHQTGKADESEVKEKYRQLCAQGIVTNYLYDMQLAYAAADIVICRAGASTLAELSACGKASVLVPYPYAARNHQEVNARKLLDMGACRMILDKDISGTSLAACITDLYENPKEVASMERASRSLVKPDSAKRVVELAYELIKQ